MNATDTNTHPATGQIPAAERFALRTVEARIAWWVREAKSPTVAREKVAA